MTKTAACTDGVDNDDVDTVLVHILLTGASGYLGQHLLAHWITHGLELGVRSKGSTTTATTTTTTATATTHYQTKITALYHRSEGFPGAVREFCANQRSGGGCGCGGISDVTVRSIDLTDPNDIAELLGGDVNMNMNMNANANANVNSGKKNAAAVNIVVHAAALSSPRLCQEDPDRARAINVPVAFFDAFLGLAKAANTDSDSGRGISVSVGALLPSRPRAAIVALSTDQVYDGKQEAGALYRETETETERGGLNPANVYGQTKLELEQYLLQSIRSSTSNACLCFALRSSIILGPEAPIAPDCAHGTFLDFCRSRGEGKQPTTFYTNEYRSVVRVDRVVDTIDGIIARKVLGMGTEEGSNDNDDDDEDYSRRTVIYNMGGPCRVHRMDMARAVFDRFGYDPELLLATEQKSPQSPLDISMDSSLLFRDGILDSNDNCNDTREEPGTYLKELVDYVFGAAEE